MIPRSPSPNDPADKSVQRPLPLVGWAAQAHHDLVQAEAELRHLRECHVTEADLVLQGLQRAILGVRQEERRLVERVEQDHRDTQQHLEQVHKENEAAAQVSQALLDQRLGNLVLLQQRIQEVANQALVDQSVSNQSLLLKEVAEFLQPWEVSVSLKKVIFKPSSQPNAVIFGDIRVQDHSFSLHTGGCGPRGQVCALHSQEILCRETCCKVTEQDRSPLERGWTTTPRRVVEKISLSSLHSPESSRLKSHQDQKIESVSCLEKVPTILSPNCRKDELSVGSKNQKKLPKVYLSSAVEGSQPIQRGAAGKGTQGGSLLNPGKRLLSSPRRSQKELSASYSCLDLTSLSQSSDELSLGTVCDSGQAPSPADSLNSNYTFVVSHSQEYGVNRNSLSNNCHLSKSAVDLPYTVVSHGSREYIGAWSKDCRKFVRPGSPPSCGDLEVSDRKQLVSYQDPNHPAKSVVARSVSMSILDVSSHEPGRGQGGGGGPLALMEVQEQGEPIESHLIRQFGKQGSGRADFTLPSGLYCTPRGQVFIVDCGNARVQVTDPRGNILQQVTSPNSNGFARRYRNFFDIAVNTKGLVVLSCAAERTLLVFNRHGRLLQTFGGSAPGPSHNELEAPRGVTVTRLDEFLVADIRRGTLVALKLDHKTGSRLERTVVTGFHRPYLVAACVSSGMVAVSERGTETGWVPCIKVLEPGWTTVRVLGVCSSMGPILVCPWGVCIDDEGNVLVADWGDTHRIVMFPSQGAGQSLVSQGLSSPRGIGLLPEGHLVVADSMNHCVKIYQYKSKYV